MKLIKGFTLYLNIEKDLAATTIEVYTREVEKFVAQLECEIDEVEAIHIREFIAELSDQGLARNSITRALSSLKAFYKYLHDIEKVEKIVKNGNPTESIKLGSREKSLPKALSKTDILKLMEAASNEGIKSRLTVELLYGLGGRVTEIASIQVEDIDFDECYIRLHGKGSKERLNPIHESCIALIKKYMTAYDITDGYLFPHRFDESKHITRQAILMKVKALAESVGISKSKVSPHVFRHSFATHMLDSGCDMAIVQEFLGHEDIATTKIYAQVTRGNKQNNFQKFHPLAQ